jgi:signal transduction histidine kinase
VRTIVEEHSGAVRIESEPGSGTTVTIDLPERA